MRAWRLFVLKFLECGGAYGALKKSAIEAGYAQEHAASIGHRLHSDDRIQLAIREEAQKRLDGGVATAISTLIQLCDDGDKRIRLKAAAMILNRTGFHETTEQKISVKQEDISDEELLKRTAELARKHGIDPKKLLGDKIIDVDFKVIESDEKMFTVTAEDLK